MYKKAAQLRLRFQTDRGALTVENLFDLPLKCASGCDLDTVARNVNTELKSVTEESFVEEVKPDPRKAELEVAFAIVKDVIKTKQDEKTTELAKIERTAKRRKILDAIGAKEDAALTAGTKEDLEKQLAELDA